MCIRDRSTTTGITINNQAAKQVISQNAASGLNVGYALFDSNGNSLAQDNDTFENYGASITKAMILVAYLNQIGSGSISSSANTKDVYKRQA